MFRLIGFLGYGCGVDVLCCYLERVMRIEEIASVRVHWSESELINKVLDCDDFCDIEKHVDVGEFNNLIKKAAAQVGIGYDKTSLTIVLRDGLEWCTESKFCLTKSKNTLLKLIGMGDE